MNKIFVAIGLMVVLGTVSFGQKYEKYKNDPSSSGRTNETSERQSPKPAKKESDKTGGSKIAAGSSVQGQLQSTIDVHKSNVGDEVVLKTTQSIKQDGQVVVPKGANLIGHITEIQRKAKGTAESRIGMVFDRIQGKSIDVPITATIVSITNARAAISQDDMFGSDVSGSTSTSGRVSSSSRASGGNSGGLLGGVGNTVAGVGNTVGGVVNATTNTVGSVAGSATQTVGGATQAVGSTVNGIRISQSSSASANGSTTLSSNDKNLRIEKGLMFNLILNGSTGN